MKKILLVFMIAAVASTSYLLADMQNNGLDTSSSSIQEAFAANPKSCSMNMSDVAKEKIPDYTTPTTYPDGYEIKDVFVGNGVASFYYAQGEMCGSDATHKSFQDGVIQFTTTDKTADPFRISDPESAFYQYKNNSDYPDRITIKKIAGHTAMLWKDGMEKNIFIDSTGEIIAEKEVPYPAQVIIVDKESERLYMVKGYAPIDDLEEMIKSAIPSK